MISPVSTLWKKIKGNNFARSVTVLVGGTAFAQAIAVLILPVLTRLYGPEDFSLLAVYVAALNIIAIVACLRLDTAIPLPESDVEAANLTMLALCLSATTTLILTLPILLWPADLANIIGQPAVAPYLWLLPLGVWLTSSYSALYFWATRKKKFSIIAKTRVSQAVLGAITQLGAGLAQIGAGGLLFGQLMLSGAGVFGLIRMIHKNYADLMLGVTREGMRSCLIAYQNFPRYSVLDSFANTASVQLPVVLIAAVTMGPEAGYLYLAVRIMSAPMSLVGSAVAQVYLSRAPDEYRAGNLGDFSLETMGNLMKIGVGPIVFAGIVSPAIFPVVFGDQWARAGGMVAWMVPWMALQFIASPISMSMYVREWQKAMLKLASLGLLIRLGSMGLAYMLDTSLIVQSYIFSSAVFYAICLVVYSFCAEVRLKKFINKVFGAAKYILAWAVLGYVVVAVV